MIQNSDTSGRKIGELIKGLSKKEANDLLIFVAMPSFKFSHTEQKTFQNLLLEIKDSNWQSLTSKDKNYLTNRFVKVIYRYFLMAQSDLDKPKNALLLIEKLKAKGLQKNYQALVKKTMKNLKTKSLSDKWRNYFKHLLFRMELEDNRSPKQKATTFNNYLNSFDEFQIENKLRMACESINMQVFSNLEIENVKEALTLLEPKIKLSGSPVIRVFWNIFNMLSTPEKEEYYLAVKDVALNKIEHFTIDDKKEILESLKNYCVHQANTGKEGYESDYLKYISCMEKEKLFSESKKISSAKFNNAVTFAMIANDFDWAEAFIRNYSNKLPKPEKENLKLTYARLAFHKGDYNSAHEIISDYKPTNFVKRLYMDKLILKIFYEQGQYKAFEYKLESYKRHIKYSKLVPDSTQKTLLAFCSCLNYLVKKQSFELKNFQNKIPLRDYKWIEKKLVSIKYD